MLKLLRRLLGIKEKEEKPLPSLKEIVADITADEEDKGSGNKD